MGMVVYDDWMWCGVDVVCGICARMSDGLCEVLLLYAWCVVYEVCGYCVVWCVMNGCGVVWRDG